MGDWQDISTAPRDGTPVLARIPGHGEDNVIAWLDGFIGDSGDCGAWGFVEDQEAPDCWTDGVCWDTNEDGKPSARPTHWMPLPEPPKP